MAYQYTERNGQRIEVNVAADFDRMNAAFQRDTGCTLYVTSGTRTSAEQEAIFRARYVLSGQVNGRRVYDTRWWNGQLWYRISNAGTVAVPRTSNHEENGPNGPRSIDIRDSGSNAGVTVRGSARDKWMEAHAGEFNFENEGYKFGEAWHKTNRGNIGAVTPIPPVSPPSQRPNPWSVVKGWAWNGVAAMLRKYYGYRGDNVPGPSMMSAFQRFLNANGYNAGGVDGQYGDNTAKAHQRWLKAKYGYTGNIDAWMGDGTHACHNSANQANWNAFPGYRQ